MIDTFTIICCLIIVVAFLMAWGYIRSRKDEDMIRGRNWTDQLPSLISTLGVLGTFAGITKGLLSFDTANLDRSIPLLLDGMKTAFFTSLLGMTGSIILNRALSHKLDKSIRETPLETATRKVVEALDRNQINVSLTINQNYSKLPAQMIQAFTNDTTIKAIYQDLEQIKDDVEEIKAMAEGMKDSFEVTKAANMSEAEEQRRLRAMVLTATASINAIDNNIDDLKKMMDKSAEE